VYIKFYIQTALEFEIWITSSCQSVITCDVYFINKVYYINVHISFDIATDYRLDDQGSKPGGD